MKYDEIKAKLSRAMNDAIADNEVAGVNILVTKDDSEIIYAQEGMADKEAGRPMSRDAIFRMYSMTKPITATAAMILMERGQIDLGQPVADFIPVYAKQKVYDAKTDSLVEPHRAMCIKDLLNMTSGLVYGDGETVAGKAMGKVIDDAQAGLEADIKAYESGKAQELGYQKKQMSTLEFAERLGECPLAFEPGSSWKYGTSADVLGAVIEIASGMKLSEFMQKEIFEPLGMRDTAFWIPAEKRDRLAAAYETYRDSDGKHIRRFDRNNLAVSNCMAFEPAYLAGGAGLASTIDDYMKFASMLLHGGSYDGKRILSQRTVSYMTGAGLEPQQRDGMRENIDMPGFSYSNLMRVCTEPSHYTGLAVGGEYGWDGWLGMYFANIPAENMTILMGTQRTDAGTFGLTKKLRNIILSQL